MSRIDMDWSDTCACGHDGWSHLCDWEMCARIGTHTERCGKCDCPDFLPLSRASAKQATLGIETDVVRHNSVDADVREVDVSDIKAAYRDEKDEEWRVAPWDWRRII